MKDKIKNLRVALLYSQPEFAKVVGVTHSSIQKWESGTASPSLRHQRKLKELANENGIEW